jgi:hypothetical protein
MLLDQLPSASLLAELRKKDNILHVTLSPCA